MLRRSLALRTLAAVALLAAGTAHADGLADLKAALARLQGQTPLQASLDIKTWRRIGEGKEMEEQQGQVRLAVEDGARGLQLLYGKDLLARVDTEQRAKRQEKKARTPSLWALRELEPTDARAMTLAAAALSREVDEAVYKGEVADTRNGKPARRLNFEMPIERLTERERKYVRNFDAALQVWIAQDGTPLASELHLQLSGRAFVVVSFEQKSDEERSYGVVGDRLVLLRKEERGRSSGAGEQQEFHISKGLQL